MQKKHWAWFTKTEIQLYMEINQLPGLCAFWQQKKKLNWTSWSEKLTTMYNSGKSWSTPQNTHYRSVPDVFLHAWFFLTLLWSIQCISDAFQMLFFCASPTFNALFGIFSCIKKKNSGLYVVWTGPKSTPMCLSKSMGANRDVYMAQPRCFASPDM